MSGAALEAQALALPGATLSVQWGDDRVLKVVEKMFAVFNGAHTSVSFKVDDVAFALLTQQPGVTPAPYLARAKWVLVSPLASLPPEEVWARIRRSYALVAAKLPKAKRPPGWEAAAETP